MLSSAGGSEKPGIKTIRQTNLKKGGDIRFNGSDLINYWERYRGIFNQ